MKKSIFTLLAIIILAACGRVGGTGTSVSPISATASVPTPGLEPTQESTVAPTTGSIEEALMVAFAKDGDLHLWDSENKQSRVIVKAGDITSVMMSSDGQVIAFLRRSLAEQPELIEYVSLWSVGRSGEDPRELVSADSLRRSLEPDAKDSAAFAQISWIPGTHRLVYNGSKHYLPGQGATLSKDIFMVDADTGAATILAADIMPDTPFLNTWHFVISPDGQQIALFSGTELSFINTDGNNWRHAVLTYPQVGVGDAVLLPSGVWTQDSDAFVFTGPMPSESIFILNYTIWLVPADGTPAQPLAELIDSHSGSVTYSPDGKQLAFLQDLNGDGTIQASDFLITSLPTDVGRMALPPGLELFYTNVHWSPGGDAYAIIDRNLFRLCPDATDSSEVCGDPILLDGNGDIVSGIHWVDAERFLFTSIEPSMLSLGNVDGIITPIVTWTDIDPLAGWSFYTPQ